MSTELKMTNEQTRAIEEILRSHFRQVDAYRYNLASVRVRVVDDKFLGKSKPERHTMVWDVLRGLSRADQRDISILLPLTPDEVQDSLMNQEFEAPGRSFL